MKIRVPRRDWRTYTAAAAATAAVASAAVTATVATPALSTFSAASSAARPGCASYDTSGLAGFNIDTCMTGGTGDAGFPDIYVNAARQLGVRESCKIDIEVWDDANHKLADTPADCGLGLHHGDVITVSTNTRIHTFARVWFDGSAYGTGDSPIINIQPPVANRAGKDGTWGSWCPAWEPTRPTCDQTGAFQNDQPNDYGLTKADPALLADALANAETGKKVLAALPKAIEFFNHYLDGTGSDLNFDSTQPYKASSDLRISVDNTVAALVTSANNTKANTFDSGYQRFEFDKIHDTEWAAAMGGCFYRVAGSLQSDGTWSVRFQLTSYYQFRDGINFTVPLTSITVYGTKMRYLEKVGKARNFREVGAGTLTYTHTGDPTWIPAAPVGGA